jgi:hypothetical protein
LGWEFSPAIIAVLAFKYPHRQHFPGRKIRREAWREIGASPGCDLILIIALHLIMHSHELSNVVHF